MKHKKGFTLIEMLLSITIIAIIGVVGTIYFLNLRDRKILDETAEEIVFALRNAQQKSISQEIGPDGEVLYWGICFINSGEGNNSYELCSDSCVFLGGEETYCISTSFFDRSAVFLNPSSGNRSFIGFIKRTGERRNLLSYYTSTVTIALTRDNSISKTINVNEKGVISY